MAKLKEMLSDWKYIKVCLYIVFTAALLYIVYLLIGNLDQVIKGTLAVLGSVASAFSPLIIGLIIAYLLSPLVELINRKLVSRLSLRQPTDPVKLEKRLGLERTVSILITFLLIFLIICAIIYAFAFLIVGDLVFTSMQNMVGSITDYFTKYETLFRGWVNSIPSNSGIEERLQSLASDAVSWLSDHFSTASIIGVITAISGSILNLLLGTVVSIYLLKDKEFFLRLWRKTLHHILPAKAKRCRDRDLIRYQYRRFSVRTRTAAGCSDHRNIIFHRTFHHRP